MNRNQKRSFLLSESSWCNEINEEDVTEEVAGCMDEEKIEKKKKEKKATRQLVTVSINRGTSSWWEESTVSNLRSSIARCEKKEKKKKLE